LHEAIRHFLGASRGTAQLYHPNIKVDVLAIPLGSPTAHRCRWRVSMRSPDDPEYVLEPREA
jgi:hypothetical protein